MNKNEWTHYELPNGRSISVRVDPKVGALEVTTDAGCDIGIKPVSRREVLVHAIDVTQYRDPPWAKKEEPRG